MGTDRLAPMGRPVSELSTEYRRALRRAARRSQTAETELRAQILAGIDAGEPQAAIARELGIGRDVLWARLKSWERALEIPDQRPLKGDGS